LSNTNESDTIPILQKNFGNKQSPNRWEFNLIQIKKRAARQLASHAI
jgi:hypothetical protein